MKRVLFVDDEPRILDSLRLILASREGHWEMDFASGGDEALNLLGAKPFDVIVSDIRMPGMDGAELLKTVCQRFPGVVRIVLSSQDELEGALRAVPVAHQFLLKPCDPVMLRVAIERATSLSSVMSNKLLGSLVGSVQDLPVLSRTFLSLRQALAEPEVSVKKVIRIVEQDVAVSAKILQLVNSSFFGLPREVSSVQTAVTFLGVDMIQGLVLSTEVFHVFEKAKAIPGFSFEEFHAHSQLVTKIVGRIPVSAHTRGIAVVAGMLHDVGKLVLATRSTKHFARALEGAREEKKPLFLIEEELIGISHAEVGAYLLGLWGLPTPVVEAVAHHHHPERIPQDALDAVGIVHIANFLAHEHPVRQPGAEPHSYRPLDPGLLDSLGVAGQIEKWGEYAEAAAEEMCGTEKTAR
jgi:HD-like signal output (HDOD) protein